QNASALTSFIYYSDFHHHLSSFPTRRSSDLFMFNCESVARLRFDCCRAAFQKPIGMFLGDGEKLVLTCGARFFDSRPDSAAGFCDLFVAFAAGPALEIIQSIPAKNQMGMRIYKSRQHD